MLGLKSRKCFCSLLSNKLTFLFFKRPAKEVNFLSKNKQIFDIYNFKIALKRVRLIRKVISSCFAAYGNNIFGKKVEQSDLFVELLCFCLLKYGIYFLYFADDMSTSFCSDDN